MWEVRKAGLNIMMSMKGDGKPVSFIEDCAVPLEHLADYTERLTQVFAKHGTRGTFYAHASVGCLHVRPVLNLRTEHGAKQMRAIAEEACALVKEYKGSYSGEHGDGLVRSEWIEPVYGARLTRAFGEIKQAFDPKGLMNPGKIVAAPKMDDRSLFRFKPDYQTTAAADGARLVGARGRAREPRPRLRGRRRDVQQQRPLPQVRRRHDVPVLPRHARRAARDARPGELAAPRVVGPTRRQTRWRRGSSTTRLALCVSCKGCKRECPTGVDMAAMKVEFLHHYHRHHRRSLHDRLVAHLPRYARAAARFAPLLNLRDRIPALAKLSEVVAGFAAAPHAAEVAARLFPRERAAGASERRRPGRVRSCCLRTPSIPISSPRTCARQSTVLTAGGYAVRVATAGDGRALCCGRTYLATGMLDAARAEARRLLDALAPFAARGVPIVGLEPSCILGLRDELQKLCPGATSAAVAGAACTFEEFLVARACGRTLVAPVQAVPVCARPRPWPLPPKSLRRHAGRGVSP